jgi:hypothetical protein
LYYFHKKLKILKNQKKYIFSGFFGFFGWVSYWQPCLQGGVASQHSLTHGLRGDAVNKKRLLFSAGQVRGGTCRSVGGGSVTRSAAHLPNIH